MNETGTAFIICGQDSILDTFARYMQNRFKNITIYRAYEGSYNALSALYRNQVQAVATHLWDGETNEYNTPFAKIMLPGIHSTVINICYRVQGFYVAKDNPKNITGWEDLKRDDISIINREAGSGSRVLLDNHLKLLGIEPEKVSGYYNESVSPAAIATKIAGKVADIGISTEKQLLHSNELTFIPLQRERYDLIIRNEGRFKEHIKATIEILKSESFKDAIGDIYGYDFSDTGKIVGET